MLSKEIQTAIDQLFESKKASLAANHKTTPEGTIATRKMLDQMLGSIPVPECISVRKITGEETEGEFYTYDVKDPDKAKDEVLLFVHGGGFMTGSVASRRQLCTSILTAAKMDGYSVEYRQWPEAVHPAGLEDCIKAYHWLLAEGFKPENIHLFGESAGATLVLTLALYLRDHNEPVPESVTVFSPVISQDPSDDSFKSHVERRDRDPMLKGIGDIPYFSEKDYRDPYASPLYTDWKGFPRLSIHVGTEELLYDHSIILDEVARKAGVDVTLHIWQDLFHVFPLFPSPETDIAIKEIAEYIRNH